MTKENTLLSEEELKKLEAQTKSTRIELTGKLEINAQDAGYYASRISVGGGFRQINSTGGRWFH